MGIEGSPDGKLERESITDEQCVEAMRGERFEIVREWYDQQLVEAEADRTSGKGKFNLTVKLATLQFEAGVIDPETGENYGFQTLKDALEHADQARDWETVDKLQAIVADYRKKNPQS